jgi:hypothetical protein
MWNLLFINIDFFLTTLTLYNHFYLQAISQSFVIMVDLQYGLCCFQLAPHGREKLLL